MSRLLVRAGLALSGPRPHWIWIELKERLGVDLRKRMVENGFIIYADPNVGITGFPEAETRQALEKLLVPGAVFIDVGAYIGHVSMIASRLVGPEGRVIACEPSRATYISLRKNVASNGCSNVVCLQLALSDCPGAGKLYIYPSAHDCNSLRKLNPASPGVDVKVSTVDRVVAEQKLARLDALKIDTEGNDLAVLHGAKETIARWRPALIIEVSRFQHAYGYNGSDLAALLEASGYQITRLDTGQPYQYRPDELSPECRHFNIMATQK